MWHTIRNDPKERNHIYRMNPLKSQNRRSRYPLGIALRVARAAPPRGFHNKGGRGVCALPLDILGCIIRLSSRCARAQLSPLDCRLPRPEKKRKSGGGKLGIAQQGSNFDSGTPPPSPSFDRGWKIHGEGAPATHVRLIFRWCDWITCSFFFTLDRRGNF